MTKHDGNSRFPTIYNSDRTGFRQKLGVNDGEIASALLPILASLGCYAEAGLDKESCPRAQPLLDAWIDRDNLKDLRLADILVKINNNEAFIEFKDQPQMNQFLSTGCRIRLIRNYIAIQHHFELPLFMIFRDNEIQESGKSSAGNLDPYVSAYKDENGFYPYGGLLFDLRVCYRSTCPPFARNRTGRDDQLRWTCQDDYQGKEPLMKSLAQNINDLSAGVRRMQGDPGDLSLWTAIQRWSKEFGLSPLTVPKDGLIWFTAKKDKE